MGLLQELENRILNQLAVLFQPITNALTRLFNAVKSFFTAFIDLIPETIALVKLILSEVEAWRNFRENINFKSGVINLQSAKDRIEQLTGEVVDAWHALVSIWRGAKINPLEQINEAAASLADVIEEFGKIGKFGEFLKGIGPKLEKMGGKVFEVLAIIQQIAETILDVVRKLSTIVTAIKDIRETFETGEGLFLSQKNKRRLISTTDGKTIKIRVGSLHPA